MALTTTSYVSTAAGQEGLIARRQLVALGMTREAIRHRVRRGDLVPRPHGVFAVGGAAPTPRSRWMEALLGIGDDAVLSHRSAAAFWGLGFMARGRIEVTVPRLVRRPGLDVHRGALAADEWVVDGGLRVTTVARTLLDLAAVARRDQLERAVRDAEVRGLADRTDLATLLDRHPRRRGTANLRAVLPRARDGRTKSELEEAFLRFLDRCGLPRPLLNHHVEGKERDCVWPAARLVVELDGRRFHDDDDTFDADRARDRRLLVAGWHTARVTWRHIEEDAERLEADLRALTARATL